jgi:ribose transport system ATP-binding protein
MSEAVGMTIEALALRSGATPFSTEFCSGEIVGLAGLDGHGQQRFLETLAGLEQPIKGVVSIRRGATPTRLRGFRHGVANGIAYLPRDRRATGIFPSLSILDNFAISTVWRDTTGGIISTARRRERFEAYRQRLSIKAPDLAAPITTLSGGNQQKVLLARALALGPDILLLNDPTRGVDVATRHILYDVFRGLAGEGMTLVILSSEIEEILVLCQRVLVFREHALATELTGNEMSADRVISAMFGRVS